MNDENIKNLVTELEEAGALKKEAEELSLLSKNISNLYDFQRSENLKSKFLMQAVKNRSPYLGRKFFLTATFSILLLLTGGTIAGAQKSLPGDLLYPVKIASEKLASRVDPSFKGKVLERRSEELKGVSKKSSSEDFYNALKDYEKELNDNDSVSKENINNSRINLEDAQEASLEENKKDIERVILETQERQREFEEDVEGETTGPDNNNENENKNNRNKEDK